MRLITQKEIKEINRLYAKLHTYAAVARATGFSPATVKKYVIPNYNEPDPSTFIHYEGPLPEFDPTPFRGKMWGTMLTLSDEEKAEIEILHKELDA